MTDQDIARQVLFPGLIYNEQGEQAQVAYVGGVAHYVINDQGFQRHVEAAKIDDAIVAALKEQITSNQSDVVRGMMQMLGQEDLFTKAAIDAAIRNLEQNIRQANPDQWVPSLQLFGFRVVVNVHGEIVEIIYPTQPEEE